MSVDRAVKQLERDKQEGWVERVAEFRSPSQTIIVTTGRDVMMGRLRKAIIGEYFVLVYVKKGKRISQDIKRFWGTVAVNAHFDELVKVHGLKERLNA